MKWVMTMNINPGCWFGGSATEYFVGDFDGKKTYHVDIFVDKSSVELFVDGGRIAMTNLVFPVAPYENVKLYIQDGKAEFKNLKVHKLGL